MAVHSRALTIFQKMLVAPLVGVLLYSGYLFYIYGEHKESSATISEIRDSYLPVLEVASENVVLFGAIAGSLKDAVQPGEKEWVVNTLRDKEQIEQNLARLNAYTPIVQTENVTKLSASFGHYYDNAFALSMAMMKNEPMAEGLNQLIENVERFHTQVSDGFGFLKSDLQRRFSEQIDEINNRSRRLVLIGVGMGAMLILLIVGVTFAMSLSTRRSLNKVNMALKNIAEDNPDFSARLNRHSDDELGEMVSWFNLLAGKLEKDYKKLELLSITDKLTQLYNRAKIDELFQFEINKVKRYQQPLSVILLDIDYFKSVNDTYGHQVGDRVLREMAEILRSNVRDVDHLGRWGGEEFIILSSNTTLEHAQQLAEKLRLAIADFSFSTVGKKTASFGVAIYREGDDGDRITKRADDCLYIAKERGRNIVVQEIELQSKGQNL